MNKLELIGAIFVSFLGCMVAFLISGTIVWTLFHGIGLTNEHTTNIACFIAGITFIILLSICDQNKTYNKK